MGWERIGHGPATSSSRPVATHVRRSLALLPIPPGNVGIPSQRPPQGVRFVRITDAKAT